MLFDVSGIFRVSRGSSSIQNRWGSFRPISDDFVFVDVCRRPSDLIENREQNSVLDILCIVYNLKFYVCLNYRLFYSFDL